MTWRSKPILARILQGVAAAWLVAALPVFMPTAQANNWGEMAMISATLGVNDSRICIGEISRGDIGCPVHAPFLASSGAVGIGMTAPIHALDVSGSQRIGLTSADSNGAAVAFVKSRGGAVMANDRLMGLYSMGMTDGGLSGNIAAIEVLAAEDFTTTANGTWLRFGTTARGSTSRVSNRMVLSPDGLLGISLPTTEPSATIHIRGSIRLGTEISSTLNICNPNRTGAIKYESGDFHYCRNGSSWESLASLSSSTHGDRITSGTTGVYTYSNTSASIATAGIERVVIGANGNVGLGQQPEEFYNFAVSGTLKATSSVIFGDATQTTASLFQFSPSNVSGTLRFTHDMNANYIQSGLENKAGSAKDLRFGPVRSTTPWMTISSLGNVGIGQQPANNIALSVSGSAIQLNGTYTDPSLSITSLGINTSGVGLGLSAFGSTFSAPWADASTVELASYSNSQALQFRTSRNNYTAPFIFKMGSTGEGGINPVIEVARITSNSFITSGNVLAKSIVPSEGFMLPYKQFNTVQETYDRVMNGVMSDGGALALVSATDIGLSNNEIVLLKAEGQTNSDDGFSVVQWDASGFKWVPFRITGAGRVGIGITAPAHPLDVSGTARATVLSAETATGNWIASQAEAEAGTDNTQVMTPLRVFQAITKALGTSGIPTGAIMAFDLTSCPSGWSEYTPARGRFLRGIDSTGTNDPDGVRALGSIQADANRSHTHTGSANSAGTHSHNVAGHSNGGSVAGVQRLGSSTFWANVSTDSAGAHTHTLSINADGAAEARPKNVAVLYCRKS